MGTANSFPHLLAPGRLGSLQTRNRIAMAPMGSNLAEPTGHVGERMARYYEERARGGVGLIIMGVGAIAYPAGTCIPNQVAISDDAFLPGLQRLTERAHAHGAAIAIQLQHAGKVATQDIAAGRPLWVPSALPPKAGDILSDLTPEEVQGVLGPLTQAGARLAFHEMTAADIETVVEQFASAADRARRAGFDGVEIHAAHGYLLSSFLSPASNQRRDDYGGSLENRARLLVEVLHAVRRRVGSEYPVWCRLDAKEFRTENGISVEEAQRTAELAEAAGADAIHVSAYGNPTSGIAFTEAPLVHEPCGYAALAAGIKQRVRVPVIAVGRIEPGEAEEMLRAGRADFIAMARKLLADPELPNKLAAGRPGDIRPCVYCYTCVGKIFLNQSTCCAVNPATGREAEFELAPAARAKQVLVVGGGPAGMEAARVAALRGHGVTLCDQRDRLGGTLLFSALVYAANGPLVEYLETQVRTLPVELRLGETITPPLLQALRPDVVILAVGARRERPSIPGIDRKNVLTGDDLRSLMTGSGAGAAAEKLSMRQRAMLAMGNLLRIADRAALTRALTRHWMPIGTRVAIIGGGLVGLEVAEFLCERGRQVTVLEESATLGLEMALPRRWRALHGLRAHGASLLTGARVEAITDAGVSYACNGHAETIAADSVIVAIGVRENRVLAERLRAHGFDVRIAGDCGGVGYIEGALRDAARVAREI